jgi:hypothetical protein
MKPIPIKAAKAIADDFGYHQIVIIARAVGEGEHVTTYGIDAANCAVAARIGEFLKFKVMGWAREHETAGDDDVIHQFRKLLTGASQALKSYAYGNTSPDLASGIAAKIDEALAKDSAHV